MAVSVNISESEVTIENVIKKSSISLDHDAWENLVECSEEVAKSIADKKSSEWMLQPNKNIRINTSVFNKAVYIHIREWYLNHPTRKRVSFYEKDWPELSEHFVSSDECKLAKKVMTTMVRLETKMKMNEECEGCIKSYPSQKDHDCLMNAMGLAYRVMEKVVIKPEDFIFMLAQEAVKDGVVLKKPYEAFKRVTKDFHMNAIKEAVVEEDYNF